jgi:hypothetical protein
MRHVTIKQALQRAADYPTMQTTELTQVPTHELIARTLFEIANSADPDVRGSLSRANKARTMIFNRLVGRRRAGSHPATRESVELEFIDLTEKQIAPAENFSEEVGDE